MKKYKIKPTKKQLDIMKDYWKRFQKRENYFYQDINKLENEMVKKTGIKGIEFFFAEYGGCVGIGNISRTMKLIHGEELVEMRRSTKKTTK